jgi:hypothetical protein
MRLRSRQDAALEPVRAALHENALSEAARTEAEATRAAAALLARARADAERVVAQAEADGALQAEQIAAAELARTKRAARSISLGAQEITREYLAGRIGTAVLALRERADYPLLRDRLSEIARRAAGSGAVITEHADGGIIATAPGVLVDCSLGRLADRAIEALGVQIAELVDFSPPQPLGGGR